MAQLAFYTFGIMNAPRDADNMKEFWDRTPAVFEKAKSIPGFIDRSGYPGGIFGGGESWGPMVNPRFYSPGEHHGALQTLSLWHDLESMSAFSYHGPHADALRTRHEWFSDEDAPRMVLRLGYPAVCRMVGGGRSNTNLGGGSSQARSARR